MIRCERCGADNTDDALYCQECGEKLGTYKSGSEEVFSENQYTAKETSKDDTAYKNKEEVYTGICPHCGYICGDVEICPICHQKTGYTIDQGDGTGGGGKSSNENGGDADDSNWKKVLAVIFAGIVVTVATAAIIVFILPIFIDGNKQSGKQDSITVETADQNSMKTPKSEVTKTPGNTTASVPDNTSAPKPIDTPTPKPIDTPTPKPTDTPTPIPTPEPTLTPTPTPTPVPEENAGSDVSVVKGIEDPTTKSDIVIPGATASSYLWPDADKKYYSESDLNGLTEGQVRYLINEIYAREGYTFGNPMWAEYFAQKTWYTPTVSTKEFKEHSKTYLNDYEYQNVNMIVTYQQARGLQTY